MDRQNIKGQVLVELGLVMLLVVSIFFAALSQISEVKKQNSKYQFGSRKTYGKDSSSRNKK